LPFIIILTILRPILKKAALFSKHLHYYNGQRAEHARAK
jgi:hypothetical protein